MNPRHDVTIGELAASQPASIKVFQRYGIDFCCGGQKPLAELCAKKGIDAQQVLADIARESAASGQALPDFAARSSAELITFIVEHYHARLREDLPRLVAMADKVLRVHGSKDPDRLGRLAQAVHLMQQELEPHLDKEEIILFPRIAAGAPGIAHPVNVMMHDHNAHGALLEEIRALTQNYKIPEGACGTWRALWQGLRQVDAELQEHIHLENNILFPRVLKAV